MDFKVGDQVTFQTHRGRSGSGRITAITSTSKGAFYEVEETAGAKTKLRAKQLAAAA